MKLDGTDHGRTLPTGAAADPQPRSLTVLLVEDDPADAVLVREVIADIPTTIDLIWARSIDAAQRELHRQHPDCVLLDLDLPDANGIDALTRVTQHDDTIPVVVLTGFADEHFGASALTAGAQDYLVKGRVDPETLRRSLLYAIERKRAEQTTLALRVSELHILENARLERGLVPHPLLLHDPGIDLVARHRPRRTKAFLGGDFYDVVQTPDRTVHVLIGDVAGHGPEAAALAVALRITWRTLTFARLEKSLKMQQLERMLHAEGGGQGIFATITTLALQPATHRVTVVRAGHPGMLLHTPESVDWIHLPAGPALGLNGGSWPEHHINIPRHAGLVLLTDGLYEGHDGPGDRRLGEEGLLRLARPLAHLPGPQFVDALIADAEERAKPHGGLSDDVAVLRLQTTNTPFVAERRQPTAPATSRSADSAVS